ncbi:DUF4124 domain-containing protein [Metapseudomonas otitidis]|uniref:DUF4124 domain-containing protein n=1 Tax=Metapseudomonas otitidis TaxID=319939 RepID=UPI0015FEFEED|nr:DUF4124 domain-containing protein [Pseudomonas otitidis]
MKLYALMAGVVVMACMHGAQAAIYKCPGADGKVTFSDRPCGGVEASPDHEIQVQTYEVGGQLATDKQIKEQQRRAAQPSAMPRSGSISSSQSVCKQFSSTELRTMVIRHQVVTGMPAGSAQQAWGAPSRVNGSQYAYHWVSGGSSFFYVEGGCVRTVQGGYGGKAT